MELTHHLFFHTSWGWMGLVGSSQGLQRVILPQPTYERAYEQLQPLMINSTENEEIFGDLPQRLKGYFQGKPISFPDELDFTRATPFYKAVWMATTTIPYGETESYGWLASKVGREGAARAVGQAMRNNPWPIVVPCHRVLASNGTLCGFACGLEMKKRLLKLEGYSHA